MAILFFTAELAAAVGSAGGAVESAGDELALAAPWWRVAKIPPTAAAAMMTTTTGTPNLSHGLMPLRGGGMAGVM
jgi:hypothetical protein